MTMIQTFPAGGGVGVPSGGTKDQALVKNSNTDKDVTWKTITPGHIIEDSAAAATQRDTVQIKGLSVSDDSTNQKTIIEGVGLNSDSLDDITSGSINNIFVQPSYDYSTTEKIIGKWIDGKPVYQRTYTFTSPNTAGTNLDVVSSIPANLDQLVGLSGVMTYTYNGNKYRYNVCEWRSAGDYSSCWLRPSSIAMCVSTSLTNQPCVLTIQYTKTTD